VVNVLLTPQSMGGGQIAQLLGVSIDLVFMFTADSLFNFQLTFFVVIYIPVLKFFVFQHLFILSGELRIHAQKITLNIFLSQKFTLESIVSLIGIIFPF